MNTAPDIAETLPHSIEAEQALLGAVLYDNALIEDIGWLDPVHFYDPVHGRIFEWCRATVNQGRLADAVTLNKAAQNEAGLADIGGASYLAVLLETACDEAAAVEYAHLIEDFSKLRAFIGALQAGLADAETSESADQSIETLEAKLAELSGTTREINSISAGDALRKALENPVEALPTGLNDLDSMNVIAPSLIVVAGRSSMGKSAFTLDLACRTADRGMASLVLSNEMTDRQIAARLASRYCGVPYTDILHGKAYGEDRGRVVDTLEKLDALPLTIIGIPGAGVPAIQAITRRWKRDQAKAGRGIGIVALDYIQNVKGEGNSLYESMSGIATGLQTMQLKLDVTLIAACQINRANENQKDKSPTLAQLRDSGKIEEVADSVILLHRESYYADREKPKDDAVEEGERRSRAASREVTADIAKNRHGAIGKISLWADLRLNLFDNWSER
jgi:replicative DNA helicase